MKSALYFVILRSSARLYWAQRLCAVTSEKRNQLYGRTVDGEEATHFNRSAVLASFFKVEQAISVRKDIISVEAQYQKEYDRLDQERKSLRQAEDKAIRTLVEAETRRSS